MDGVAAAAAAALGVGVGLSLAAPPGPMNVIIAQQAAHHGWPSAVRVGVAAPVADTLYLAVVLLGLHRLVDLDALLRPAAALGALLMAYFAWSATRTRSEGKPPPARFLTVLALSLTNPFQLAWWLTAGVVLLTEQGTWAVGGFLLGVFGWVVAFAFAMAQGAQRWPWFSPLVVVASVDLLVAFTAVLAVQAL